MSLHDVPSAAELVEAVREFLTDQVLDELSGARRFHTLVAINALGIVERELALDGADVREHEARLAALGYDGDAALVAAIRSGIEDERYHDIKAAVASSVAAKLQVANPRYLEDSA